ncbi:disheveled-associated activator of morphogenesis 1 isoform X1 [Colias croceus]|uniref:disheveled-associated activator of morphogenesis 1 isoform X1 n=3 Tax=Colias crocea TaxID=72248 RepID=UPI001E27A1E5|nr:disheveled-associated activator of morphogenesis 1 isoform X1 [Colias croceus]XP_045499989.1 disheveled-associated activator of morphogenesis 1 isoform X1 [Colias croceus]XP_045499990.1 disheveled-associated activator of morphogenesis 1 isoform X1 [Colias croceus]XP_045499991.1 disheveled-associated activator of morphogenesis 1 isoform X1 [Colias croceus]
MCSKDQISHILGKINVGLPSWSRGLEAAEAARARLVRWACGEPAAEPEPRKKMPHAMRRRWPMCPCLQNDEPPEITYCVVGGEGGLALQAVTPTHPMPSQDELDAKFAELVEELDLTAVNKAAMMELPAAKKWQIYCSRRPPPGQALPLANAPQVEDYIKALNEIADAFASSEGVPPTEASGLVDGLKTALRTRAHSFVLRFIKQGGLTALLEALQRAPRDDAVTRHNLIAGIKALMNNSTGRAHVLAHPTSIDLIAQSLDTENVKTKVAALEILGAVCLVPGGHKKVLEAMTAYQKHAGERARFSSVVGALGRGAARDQLPLDTALMSFVNAVLSYGPGEDSLEFRLHLRYELLMLGIQPVIEKLRKYENETLDRHIEFFEMVRSEDERELARRFEKQHVDTRSAGDMFELLRNKLSHTAAYPHLLSMLRHLLLLPLEYNPHAQHWLLLDRVVQQVVLQQPRPGDRDSDSAKVFDPDVAPLEINVGEIVQLLAKEEELVAARNKADSLEKENVDLATELAKKEKQVDQQSQEREELEGNLRRLQERLERETAAHMACGEQARAAACRAHQLEQQLNQERAERARFEKLVSEGSIPDDAKVSNLKSAVIETCSAPPPPPPPILAAPPPPAAPLPPPAPLAPFTPTPPRPKKNVPTPGNPLKSFNWSKLPDTKLHGTIWQELDDTKLYNAIDLHAIDKMFCAYQKNGVQNEGSVEDLRQLGSKPRTKILSVIDGRRAQNCTILLSKLKMSDEEICRAILRMDSSEQLPIDMVEQLCKFTPSAEEAALLEEHQDELDSMARADRFLYEISKIPHYQQRVRTLLFKKKFSAAVAEATSRASVVLRAARDMTRSRRLKTLLEIVLALGNYMNRGARGNASGFRLSSLSKLADTKSSVSRNTTLLHYLVEMLETQFKDVLLLEEDVPHVRSAGKVCVEQLERDVTALRAGLRDVARELEYHASLPARAQHDAFVPVMREFHAHAVCSFTQLEDLFQDMKSRLEACAHAFGEEPSASPEQLFGALDSFLVQLAEARAECDAARRRREEDERRSRHEQELKKRTMERKQGSSILGSVAKSLGKSTDCNGHSNGDTSRDGTLTNGQKGEFDDLISALRTGDVFGDDVAKFKRSRKSKTHKGRDSPPRGVCREDSRERQKN